MHKITLYRYIRPNGGVTVSPVKPDAEYTVLHRLIADEGMELVNGTDKADCIDTETPELWHEVEKTEEESR